MRLICLIFALIQFVNVFCNEFEEKYRPLREQCQRTPTSPECVKIKAKFLDLIKKCRKSNTPEQVLVCQQVRGKLCAVFPSECNKKKPIRKKTGSTTRLTTTQQSIIVTTPPPVPSLNPTNFPPTPPPATSATISNEEFVKVPVNPEELRSRGEYCVRHGKEKKCQELLTNLKNTYSSCSNKKPPTVPTKPEQIDCHSFQTHLCKAFPKFPPCLKKTKQ